MNIKVVIEVDGSAEEVEAWLTRFGLSKSGGTTAFPPVTSAGVGRAIAQPISAEWTPEVADRLIRRITPLARKALWHMAMHAPEITFSELQDEMNLNGLRMGGVLASFGFAENAGIPRPYSVDKRSRRYLIDPETAELVRGALDRREAEKQEE